MQKSTGALPCSFHAILTGGIFLLVFERWSAIGHCIHDMEFCIIRFQFPFGNELVFLISSIEPPLTIGFPQFRSVLAAPLPPRRRQLPARARCFMGSSPPRDELCSCQISIDCAWSEMFSLGKAMLSVLSPTSLAQFCFFHSQ